MHESVWRGEGQNRWQMDGVVAKVKGARLLSLRYSAVILLTVTRITIKRPSRKDYSGHDISPNYSIYIFPALSSTSEHHIDTYTVALASLTANEVVRDAHLT